jgi:hypothetical protein
MRTAILTVVLAGTVAGPAWAQSTADRYQDRNEGGRYSAEAQGVPSGYLPGPGACRVWYDGRPPGHQPPATSCPDAERVAARDRAARVIYGGDRQSWNDRVGDDWTPRAVPPRLRYADRGYPFDSQSRTAPYEQGFKDGRDKGHDDRHDDKRFDPTRHGRYQSADRGYEKRYGDKDEYRETYREGFRAGYAEGYRSVMMTRSER